MILRLQVAWSADSALPRDKVVITPHFQTVAALTDADELCEDLATALAGWATGSRHTVVTAYDAQGTPPVEPIGRAEVNIGTVPASSIPREIAVCLSYYAGSNVPRRRGRLYLPWHITGQTVSLRPQGAHRDLVGSVAPILADLGGVDVDWVVYSRVEDAAFPVSNWWVDDEWDTVRSRGLRATTRLEGTVSE